jgi:hypothetical protein
VLEEVPDRVIADLDPALRQFAQQGAKRNVQLRGKPASTGHALTANIETDLNSRALRSGEPANRT